MQDDHALVRALLAELAARPQGVSLPRLCKRLGIRMSVLLRALAWLGEARIGDDPGAGWIRIVGEEDRRLAVLTEAGLRRARAEGLHPG